MRSRVLLLSSVLAVVMTFLPLSQFQTSQAQTDVYSNLQRSRDALLNQQQELQRAYDDTRKQMDNLNSRLSRIDSYMRQVSSALRDVELAMRNAK